MASLGSLVSEATFFDVSNDNRDKYVIYSNYELVWLRVILIRSTNLEKPSILVSLYRRNAAKVERLIARGSLRRITGED